MKIGKLNSREGRLHDFVVSQVRNDFEESKEAKLTFDESDLALVRAAEGGFPVVDFSSSAWSDRDILIRVKINDTRQTIDLETIIKSMSEK